MSTVGNLLTNICLSMNSVNFIKSTLKHRINSLFKANMSFESSFVATVLDTQEDGKYT